MSVVQVIVGQIMPPITIGVVLLGLGLRLRRWWRAPTGKLTLYPSARGGGQVWSGVLKEVFLFRSLWGGDKTLWFPAWLFHAALALIVVGHVRVVTDFPRLWAAMGMGASDVDALSTAAGGTAGVIILVMGLVLLVRRFTSPAVRDASKAEDFIVLLLLLAVIGTGDAMRFVSHFELAESRAYFAGLLTMSVTRMPTHPLFWTHFLLAQVLLMYLPAGKLLHMPGVFFSHPLLRRD